MRTVTRGIVGSPAGLRLSVLVKGITVAYPIIAKNDFLKRT